MKRFKNITNFGHYGVKFLSHNVLWGNMFHFTKSQIAALEIFILITLVYLIFEVPINNEITLLLFSLLIILLILFVLLVRSLLGYEHNKNKEETSEQENLR